MSSHTKRCAECESLVPDASLPVFCPHCGVIWVATSGGVYGFTLYEGKHRGYPNRFATDEMREREEQLLQKRNRELNRGCLQILPLLLLILSFVVGAGVGIAFLCRWLFPALSLTLLIGVGVLGALVGWVAVFPLLRWIGDRFF